MIRPFTCLCLLVAAGSGLYLYSAKHDAQMLDRDITRLGRQAQESRSRAAMMRAEYDRLGDPDRLRELATMVLSLQPTDPVQFAAMADLERRLASVGASVQANPAPFEPQQVLANAVETARPAAPPVALAATAPNAPVKLPLPEKIVAERPTPPIQIAVARQVVAPKPLATTPAAVSATAPPAASATAPQVASTPASIAASSVFASAQPTPRAPLVRAAAAAETRLAPRPTPLIEPAPRSARASVPQQAQFIAPVPAPVFASALGMARTPASLPANVLTPTSYTPSALALPRR